MHKKVIFTVFVGIFVYFFVGFCFTDGYCALDTNDAQVLASMQSPREKWNYNKKEDKIDHHKRTVNVKPRKAKKENSVHKDSETTGGSVSHDMNTSHDVSDQNVEDIYRPGSPREKW